MNDLNTKILDLTGFYRRHGYAVIADAIPGEEELFISSLQEGICQISNVLSRNAKAYGYRGLSKNALSSLHRDLPNPVFGVEVY